MTRKIKYQTDEERIIAYKQQQNNYAAKAWTCNECKCTIRLGNKCKHLRSIKHKNNTNSLIIISFIFYFFIF